MANDDALTEAIRLIKAGKKDAARAILEPFLLKNPNHVPAWMWEAELFSNNRAKIKVLESCLKHNPNNPQATQALDFLKKQSGNSSNKQPVEAAPKSSPSNSTPAFYSDSVAPAPAPPQTTTTDSAPYAVENPERPRLPLPPKSAKPQKKSKRMSLQMKRALIALMAYVALFVVMGLYIGNGFYLNGQINNFFAEQNCENVVQYATFVSIYPKGIFASMFTGYDQYAECRIKLNVEQATAAKNWREAFSLAQEYLATYPNGAFAANMNEQAPNILSVWSDELIANHDYGSGVEKLQQLVEIYPKSSQAQAAPDVILQTYILWAKELTDKQNYADAEQRLNAAFAYFQTDAPRAEQVKQELVNLYVSWGDAQIELGAVDNGINYYKKAGEISPGKTDVDLLVARAYLKKAVDSANKGDFDRALVKVKEISDAARTENVKTEAASAREKILAAYSVSTSQQAIDQMTAAIALTCNQQRPELPIFGLDAKNIRFGLTSFIVKLPADWAAEKPSELHYVACLSEEEEKIEACPYTGKHFLIRIRYVWKVALYNVRNGEAYAARNFVGSDPAKCNPKELFAKGAPNKRSLGKRPTIDDILAWFEKLNTIK